MNTFKAQYIADVENLSDEALHKALSAIESHEIGCVNWAEFPYKPSASFRMAYSDKAIAILFEVTEGSRHGKQRYGMGGQLCGILCHGSGWRALHQF